MTAINTSKPLVTEYAPYNSTYVSLVPEGNIVQILTQQLASALTIFATINEEQSNSRYAPDKWSIKQLLGHLIDSERVFAYRALRFARGSLTPLEGFDQDEFMNFSNFEDYKWSELVSEFEQLRQSHISFFQHLSDEAWTRRGLANNNEVSVRTLAYMLAGHELHHLNILRSRYLTPDK